MLNSLLSRNGGHETNAHTHAEVSYKAIYAAANAFQSPSTKKINFKIKLQSKIGKYIEYFGRSLFFENLINFKFLNEIN